jgi:magnesium-transporting ATPase (P-type)
MPTLSHLIREQFITIIVSAPTRTYTSYVELMTSSLPSSSLNSDNDTSYTIATQPPRTSETGRVAGIVLGCVLGMMILAVLGYMYVFYRRWGKRKRNRKKRVGKDKRRRRRRKDLRGKKRRVKRKVRIVDVETEKDDGNEIGAEPTGDE